MSTTPTAHALGIHPASCDDHEPHTSECPDPCVHECCPENGDE